MSLGYKRRSVEINDRKSESGENLRSDPLFDADWDEFVIRFDEKQGKYNVETAAPAASRQTSSSARSESK